MRLLFVALILVFSASDILNVGLSLGHGLSVKNALLYPIFLGLIFRMALTGRFRMRLPVINVAFVLWITYAILTWVACVTMIHYPGYRPVEMGMELKSMLIDSGLIFFLYFYGAQDDADFVLLSKTLAFCMSLASILTLADVAGLVDLHITVGTTGVEAGRVFGVFDNANDTGAIIVCTLPLIVVVARASSGAARLFWYAGVFASIAVLVLTISRSAYVGLVVGYAAAVWLCRRYLPTSKVAAWTLIGVTCSVLAGAVAAVLMPGLAHLFGERLFNQSMAMSMSVASSGRTTVWMQAIETMMSQPITLLTGFGWDVYNTMFVLVTHNYYLDMWFGLGLIGLFSFVTIEYQAVVTALRAIAVGEGQQRSYMIAFVLGMLGLAVCLFFGNLDRPWCYVWIYAGFTLRAAVEMIEKARKAALERAPAGAPLGPVPRPARAAGNPIHIARGGRAAGGVRR